MISIILQNQQDSSLCNVMAKSQLNSSSNCLDNKRWRREKRRDGEAKNTTDGLKQRTEQIELFRKEKKRWRRRLSPGYRQCWLHNLQLHPSPSDHQTYLRLVWKLWTNSRGPKSYSCVQTPVQRLILSSCQLSAAGRQEFGRLRCSQGRRRRPLRAALHITIDYMQ
jgi:hypothetical protein